VIGNGWEIVKRSSTRTRVGHYRIGIAPRVDLTSERAWDWARVVEVARLMDLAK
jgi:hypothetical protein